MSISRRKITQDQIVIALIAFAIFVLLIPLSLYIFSKGQTNKSSSPTTEKPTETVSLSPDPTETTQEIKQKIISSLAEKSGVLYSTSNFHIEYVHSRDIFQVELRTTEIAAAKEEAAKWFYAQGVSRQNLCSFPVQFYTSFEVKIALQEMSQPFNPLPPGC